MSKKICTPFCDDKKPCPKHHDLLIAILNCSDSRGKDQVAGFQSFETCVKSYLKKGWGKDDLVPDPVKDYRFPLVHWASVLGKYKALEWLIQNGFNPTIQAPGTQETALHRLVLCMHQAGPGAPRRAKERKMVNLIRVLKDCLPVKDSDLDMPLHVAAKTLLVGHKPDYYEECIEAMVDRTKEFFPGKFIEMINSLNKDGNTPMHILAGSDVGFIGLRTIFHAGADSTIVNKDFKTPYDIAIENGSSRIAKLLKQPTSADERSKSKYDADFTTDSPPESEDEEQRETENHDTNQPANTNNPDKDNDMTNESHPPVNSCENGTGLAEACAQSSTTCTSTPLRPVICTCAVKKEIVSPLKQERKGLSPQFSISGALTSLTADQNSSVLLEFLKGAGLLDHVKELAVKTRRTDEKSLTSKLEDLHATNEALEESSKIMEQKLEEIDRKKKDLERLNSEISTLGNERGKLTMKRKNINDECIHLEKKLHCCDSLLKVVPENGNTLDKTPSEEG